MISSNSADQTIVVVDDEEDSFWLMQHLFKRIGAKEKVVWFSDGERALAHLRAELVNHRPLPVLMCLDLNMPGLHGFDVLGALRKSPEFSSILIVVVSSSSRPEDIARAVQLGAFCYFEKYPLPEKFAPVYAIAKERLALAVHADPCERALREIITLVETAVGVCHKPNISLDDEDQQLISLLGCVRRRATGRLLERVNAAEGMRRRWPFGPATDAPLP